MKKRIHVIILFLIQKIKELKILNYLLTLTIFDKSKILLLIILKNLKEMNYIPIE